MGDTVEIPRDVANMVLQLAEVLVEGGESSPDVDDDRQRLLRRFGDEGAAAIEAWRGAYQSFDWPACRQRWPAVEALLKG